jgi:hypothetical protein
MYHAPRRSCLRILCCPFPVWSSLDSVNFLWIRNKRFTLLGRNMLMGTSCGVLPMWFQNILNWNYYLEFIWPSSTPFSWMVIPLFKDDESYVDPEFIYAFSRRISRCPSAKFGVRIPLKTPALPDAVDITLHFWTVHFGRTPRIIIRQFNHTLVYQPWTLVHHQVLHSTPAWRLPLTTCRILPLGA